MKVTTIVKGIKYNINLSFSKKIFLIAGSSNQATAAVAAPCKIIKKTTIRRSGIYFFIWVRYILLISCFLFTYLPATVIDSINNDGEFVEVFNWRSFRGTMFLNISNKLLAIVTSLTGYANSPFSIIIPDAPTL